MGKIESFAEVVGLSMGIVFVGTLFLMLFLTSVYVLYEIHPFAGFVFAFIVSIQFWYVFLQFLKQTYGKKTVPVSESGLRASAREIEDSRMASEVSEQAKR